MSWSPAAAACRCFCWWCCWWGSDWVQVRQSGLSSSLDLVKDFSFICRSLRPAEPLGALMSVQYEVCVFFILWIPAGGHGCQSLLCSSFPCVALLFFFTFCIQRTFECPLVTKMRLRLSYWGAVEREVWRFLLSAFDSVGFSEVAAIQPKFEFSKELPGISQTADMQHFCGI